jgi:hypothetical protein
VSSYAENESAIADAKETVAAYGTVEAATGWGPAVDNQALEPWHRVVEPIVFVVHVCDRKVVAPAHEEHPPCLHGASVGLVASATPTPARLKPASFSLTHLYSRS